MDKGAGFLVLLAKNKHVSDYILNVRSDIYPNSIKISNIISMANFYKLCQILTVLPGSNVECKRGFSNLNHIKGEDRNNFKGNNLRYLMHISSFKMSDEEFNALHMPTLVGLWKGQKERRMTYEKEDVSMN